MNLIGTLTRRGYPPVLAIRIACTPPLCVVTSPPQMTARPGRELAHAVEAKLGQVAGALAAHDVERRAS